MTLRMILAASAAAAAMTFASGASAVTVHTSNFITGVTNFNGFEGIGAQSSFSGPYTEDGITVEYIGNNVSGIWTTSQSGAPGTEGIYSWYPAGGGYGYTRITLANNASFSAIQFQAGSGWFGGGGILGYELLLNGVSLASGVAGPLNAFNSGMTTFGFDGGTFDEVRLQGAQGAISFAPGTYEAGAYDAIQIASGGAIPEPATWALMIGGFGLAGVTLRRRKAAIA